MTEKKFTCGLDPKKKPYSMQKCLDMHQVRYWGKKKIDSRLLERGPNAMKREQQEKQRQDLISQRIKLKSNIKKLVDEKKHFFNRRTKAELAEIDKKGRALVKKLTDINTKITRVEKALRT